MSQYLVYDPTENASNKSLDMCSVVTHLTETVMVSGYVHLSTQHMMANIVIDSTSFINCLIANCNSHEPFIVWARCTE